MKNVNIILIFLISFISIPTSFANLTKKHHGIIFEADEAIFDQDKFQKAVKDISIFIKDHPSSKKIKSIIQKSIDKNKSLTVKFVEHSEITSSASWSGAESTIRIAVDYDNENPSESFFWELLNSINPRMVSPQGPLEILDPPTENYTEALINRAKNLAVNQETREYWTLKKQAKLNKENARPLEEYLEDQSKPHEQCHGFSHTGQYEYRFLKNLAKTLDINIKLNRILVHSPDLGEDMDTLKNKLAIQESTKKELKEYIKKMEENAEEVVRNDRDSILVKLFLTRMNITSTCVKIIEKFENKENYEDNKLLKHCQYIVGNGDEFYNIFKNKRTLKQEQELLEKLQQFNTIY